MENPKLIVAGKRVWQFITPKNWYQVVRTSPIGPGEIVQWHFYSARSNYKIYPKSFLTLLICGFVAKKYNEYENNYIQRRKLRDEQDKLDMKNRRETDKIMEDCRAAGRNDVTGGKIAYTTLKSYVDMVVHIEQQKALKNNSEHINQKQEEYRKLLELI